MGKHVLWVTSWMALIVLGNALYFYLEEGGEKCFILELAVETLVIGHYRCSAVNTRNERNESLSKEHGILVEIEDPLKRTVLSRPYHHRGRFSYRSQEPGVHTICLRTKLDHRSRHKLKIDFDLQVGEHTIDHSAQRMKLNLTDIQGRYQELIDKALDVNKETDYLRYREEKFRGITEIISQRVMLWMIGETALLIIIGLWQMENLRKFFESKKLV